MRSAKLRPFEKQHTVAQPPSSVCPRALTRLGVAEHRWAAAERGTAAVVAAAAAAAAHAAAPRSHRHLDLFSGTHWDTERDRDGH